jgi:hypothetical protein
MNRSSRSLLSNQIAMLFRANFAMAYHPPSGLRRVPQHSPEPKSPRQLTEHDSLALEKARLKRERKAKLKSLNPKTV